MKYCNSKVVLYIKTIESRYIYIYIYFITKKKVRHAVNFSSCCKSVNRRVSTHDMLFSVDFIKYKMTKLE